MILKSEKSIKEIQKKTEQVSDFLKGLASPRRLLILCHLAEGEKSVTQLIKATGIAQTSMSQHLLKLREEGIVDYRRDHRTLYYFIVHGAVEDLMRVLYMHFCKEKKQ